MQTKMILTLATAGFLVSCAHSLQHGTIAMKEKDTMAHVSIHDVRAGDKVILFRSVCEGRGGRDGGPGNCKREKLAEGTVRSVFNEHYSLVEFPNGTKFSEGDFVETATR